MLITFFFLKIRLCLYKVAIKCSVFMLFFYLYKIILSCHLGFLIYIIMYMLNIAKAITKMSTKKSKTFSLKTIIKKLDVLKKTVITQWNAWKKDLLLLANKLIEKVPDPRKVKKHYQYSIIYKEGKHKIN